MNIGREFMELAIIKNQIVPMDKVDAAYLDRGTYFGDGVYEVVRTYEGKIFALDEHISRFERSLSAVRITGVDIGRIREQLVRAYRESGIADAKIYFHITRGSEPRSHVAKGKIEPNYFLTVTEIPDNSAQKSRGIKVCTHPDLRWKRCDIKSLNLLPNILARMEAANKGCDEAILVNDQGQITEGAGSAFFAYFAGANKLMTRGLGPEILPSITREHVIRVAEKAGINVEQKSITPERALEANELFLAVTTSDILPVIEFDGEEVGNGRPGECAKKLMKLFVEHIREFCKG